MHTITLEPASTDLTTYFEKLLAESSVTFMFRLTGKVPTRVLTDQEARDLLAHTEIHHDTTARAYQCLLLHTLPSDVLLLVVKKATRLQVDLTATLAALALPQENLCPEGRYRVLRYHTRGDNTGLDLLEAGLAARDELRFVHRMEQVHWDGPWDSAMKLGIRAMGLTPAQWEIFTGFMDGHRCYTSDPMLTLDEMETMLECAQLV